MRSLVVELLDKIVELGLLLQTVHVSGESGFVFQREMHALRATILLWMTGLDAVRLRNLFLVTETRAGALPQILPQARSIPGKTHLFGSISVKT